ncbi:LAQU0S11e01530g1_1 [Lachancea quebecensis]|uniref:LAQU0S11e01530g1_1 n=1 Tax=Lachancea quebecensis TaxID=1654605 RepID=A0A0P1KUT4_9SACH|nr:LAQU0S11e01530g1_1 [Lachancea quebecensis]
MASSTRVQLQSTVFLPLGIRARRVAVPARARLLSSRYRCQELPRDPIAEWCVYRLLYLLPRLSEEGRDDVTSTESRRACSSHRRRSAMQRSVSARKAHLYENRGDRAGGAVRGDFAGVVRRMRSRAGCRGVETSCEGTSCGMISWHVVSYGVTVVR